MCEMVWSKFPWDAAATLAAGIMAVIAAYFIGRRQTTIMERQVRAEELARDIELFDRRWSVYDRTRSFLGQYAALGPNMPTETEASFLQASDEAQFLFPPEVHAKLHEIWLRWSEARAMERALPERDGPEREGQISRLLQAREALTLDWREVATIFGDLSLARRG